MKITDEDAARYIVRAAWFYREYVHAAAKGPTSKATAIARAHFDGLAEGAVALGLAMTPHAIFMAFKEAFEEVGDLEVNIAGRAENARATRAAWTELMCTAVRERLS